MEGIITKLLAPKRHDFTFLGWYDEEDNLIEEIPADLTKDITITAKWKEEKIYTEVPENANFEPGEILVVLMNEESLKLKNYTADDFPGIECAEVVNLTAELCEKIKVQLSGNYGADFLQIDLYKFNQIIKIKLVKEDRESLIEAI